MGVPPGQRQVAPSGEREGLARRQVGKRDVGGEAERGVESLVGDVVRSLEDLRAPPAPAQPRVAHHADARLSPQRLEDAEELGGPEGSLVLLESGREVDQAEGVGAVVEDRLQHVGVGEVALDARGARRRADAEAAALGLVEQRAEHRFRVEAGEAAPGHRAVPVHERRVLAIAHEPEIVEAHRSPPWPNCGALAPAKT